MGKLYREFKNRSIKSLVFPVSATGVSICAGIAATMGGTDLLGFFILSVVMLLFMLYIVKISDKRLSFILGAALFIRTSLVLVQNYVHALPDSDKDAVVFDNLGWDVAKALDSHSSLPDTPGAYLYSKLLGYIYYMVGHIQLVAGLMNVSLGVLTVYFIYRAIIEMGGSDRPALTGAAIASFFPTFNLYSAITVRENLIVLFSIVSGLFFIKWLNKNSYGYMLSSIAFLLLSSIFHGAMIMALPVYIFMFCFYNPVSQKNDGNKH